MLTEAIVAIGVLTTTLVGLAQLFAMSLTAIDAAKSTTVASILAEQKAGQLRALPWAAVAASPGSVDYLDERGQLIASGGEAPAGAMYVRKWVSTPLPSHPEQAVLVDISVRRIGAHEQDVSRRRAGTAHVIGIRTRHAE